MECFKPDSDDKDITFQTDRNLHTFPPRTHLHGALCTTAQNIVVYFIYYEYIKLLVWVTGNRLNSRCVPWT